MTAQTTVQSRSTPPRRRRFLGPSPSQTPDSTMLPFGTAPLPAHLFPMQAQPAAAEPGFPPLEATADTLHYPYGQPFSIGQRRPPRAVPSSRRRASTVGAPTASWASGREPRPLQPLCQPMPRRERRQRNRPGRPPGNRSAISAAMARGRCSGACPQALSRPRAAREDARHYSRPNSTDRLRPPRTPGRDVSLVRPRRGAGGCCRLRRSAVGPVSEVCAAKMEQPPLRPGTRSLWRCHMAAMAKALTSIALALLWLSATVADGARHGGLVLCYGADGHVAVEPVHADACGAPDAAPGNPEAQTPRTPVISAAGCTDVPLGKLLGYSLGKRLNPTHAKRQCAPQPLYAAGVPEPCRSPAGTGPCHLRQTALAPPHLSHLQTVILRL